MEPVSLAVSIASLAPLFQAALDCFHYVQLGKSFGTDFQTCLLQLDNTQLRLSRWGQAVGIGESTREATCLNDTAVTQDDKKRAEILLGHIITIFKDAEAISKRLKAQGGDLRKMQVHEPLEGALASLHERVRGICLRRQKGTGMSTKTKWALYEREHLNHLVDSVQKLVTDLIDLFPATEKRQSSLCDYEAAELRNESDLPLLEDVAAKLDQPLKEAIEKLRKTAASTTYNTWNNSDNTKVLNQVGGSQTFNGGQSFTL